MRPKYLTHVGPAVVAVALAMAAPAAHAFTLDDSSLNGNGSPRYVDPDEQVRGFANGRTSTPFAGGRLQFGVTPSYGAGSMNRFYSSDPSTGSLTGGQ